ncbi:MAG: RNA-directed DNA polymerase [Gemmataceae bacterium]
MHFDTLAARALNASRAAHKPTYVGLRLLLTGAQNSRAALDAFLTRRTVSRREWRYFSFQILKEARKDHKPEYRNCIVGSPLTTLAEAHVLSLMSSEPSFGVPACAFSSLWPAEPSSGRNFEFFLDGYERRNRRVAELLAAKPGHVAVVNDIKSFYPSVEKPRLRERIVRRAKAIQDRQTKRSVEGLLLALIDLDAPKYSGIPIGPEVGHALGHVALEGVDATMIGHYGDAYLRYVDDIIVVCPTEEVDGVTRRLQNALSDEGLALNDEKRDVVAEGSWRQDCVSFAPAPLPNTFESLVEAIVHHLIWYPGDAEELQRRLTDAGFSIPVNRFRSLSKSKRYRGHLRSRWRAVDRLWDWLVVTFTSSIDTIVETAKAVREELRRKATVLAESTPPEGSMRRRWHIQRCRYVLNRLAYLLSPADYKALLQLVPNIDEFQELRLVLEAVASGDATTILPYPGRVASTFCELWHLHNKARPPRVAWPAVAGRAEAESAATLSLYLGVKPSTTFLRAFDQSLPGGRLLLDLCSAGRTEHRIAPRTFIDEVDCLYRGVRPEELHSLMYSRHDELEDVGLEGLLLGSFGSGLRFDIPVSG